ncbi:biosynthetic peptidoglycan transglycosylase [Mycobacterium avium]|uniref:biosynthetic peptidoglycan transglycosylase n=1 Tax=Mycobacterium avium TaxID=1764 RepID=UPI0009B88FFD
MTPLLASRHPSESSSCEQSTLPELPSLHRSSRQPSEREITPQLRKWSAYSDRFVETHIRRAANFYASELDVPSHFIQLLLLIEDKRFASHPGIDLISIMRALISNSLGGDLQGASTITQQLYDVLQAQQIDGYSRPRTICRKLNQAVWSIRRERLSSKVEILRDYLANVYWGRDYFGLESASYGYFRSAKSTLSPAKSFFLAERLASPNVNRRERVHTLLQRSAVRELLITDGSVAELSGIYRQWEAQLDVIGHAARAVPK